MIKNTIEFLKTNRGIIVFAITFTLLVSFVFSLLIYSLTEYDNTRLNQKVISTQSQASIDKIAMIEKYKKNYQ
jgi:CBS domain containing-hemolysin-like protein